MTIANFNPNGAKPLPQGEPSSLANNSGQGPNTPVLDIVSKKFNWGAFLLNWIWGLGNRTYITLILFLLGFIPFLGIVAIFGCQIWFGIKGNEWAWQNKRWNSIEHFHEVQKKWAIAGIICSILGTLVTAATIVMMFIPAMMMNTSTQQNEVMVKKSVNALMEVSLLNEAQGKKCDASSEGLATCFAEKANVKDQFGATVVASDGVIWSFSGDGVCSNAGDCSVSITNDKGMFETIPLSLENGYLKVHADEILAKHI